jgi:lysophospholipase L1-like esterase
MTTSFLAPSLAVSVVITMCGAAAAPVADNAPIIARSLVCEGDTGRLQRALAKARRAEPVTVAVIGGSITAGARASSPEKNYGGVLAQWWRQTFPKAKIELVNAGIGATGSNYGALRAERDLLSRWPDFVVIEFGVNDPNSRASAETLEGLVRQTLKQPNRPAVTLLFMMNRNGGNAQEWHGKVGRHYGLPMLSFRDALWPEIQAGRIKWEEVEADEVHPNDRGHAEAARFVTALLEKILKDLPPDARLAPIKPRPKPLLTDVAEHVVIQEPLLTDFFEHVALYEADALKPTKNEGWIFDAKGKCWTSDRPGSRIEFEVEGRVVLLMDWHIRGLMGKAKVQVDDRPPVVRDAWFDQTWGGCRQTTELARDLSPGKHRVAIEILPEKNRQSTGHEYRLLGLGAAGLPAR